MPTVPKKALKLSTEVSVHAVSCPGVWLPGKGRVSLSVCLLGFHTRTNFFPPNFPMLFHEKFKFERTFNGVRTLTSLESVLDKESVYIELIQEENNGEHVLAVFECSVRDLLFPTPVERLSYSGMDLDLLMEPTRDFPGIISPKIELATRSTIRETRSPLHQCEQDTVSFGHAGTVTKAVYHPSSTFPENQGDDKSSNEEVNIGQNDGKSGKSATLNSRYGTQQAATRSPSRRRMRSRDDSGVGAKVSALDENRCPHCFKSHSSQSCTTCKTYESFFPNSKTTAHFNKVLEQSPMASPRGVRRRKRYLVDDLSWRLPRRSRSKRPMSAPPTGRIVNDTEKNIQEESSQQERGDERQPASRLGIEQRNESSRPSSRNWGESSRPHYRGDREVEEATGEETEDDEEEQEGGGTGRYERKLARSSSVTDDIMRYKGASHCGYSRDPYYSCYFCEYPSYNYYRPSLSSYRYDHDYSLPYCCRSYSSRPYRSRRSYRTRFEY